MRTSSIYKEQESAAVLTAVCISSSVQVKYIMQVCIQYLCFVLVLNLENIGTSLKAKRNV